MKHPYATLNEVANFAQNIGHTFYPVHVATAVGCTWAEAVLCLMILCEWKKVGKRNDGRWYLVAGKG